MDAPRMNLPLELSTISMIMACMRFALNKQDSEQVKAAIAEHSKKLCDQMVSHEYALIMIDEMNRQAASKQCAGISKLNKRK